ncbi:MAG: hypothetical protein AAF865_05795 [Pseudomonadota bacterium]
MFRPFRIVFSIISLSLVLGFAGLRMSEPPSASAFGGGSDAQLGLAFKLYGALYAFANKAPMPDFGGLMDGSMAFFNNGPRPPDVGRPGFSDSNMGQGLSALRERQTGVKTGPMGYGDMVDQVEKQFRAGTSGLAGTSRNGPPPAEARRIVVGE